MTENPYSFNSSTEIRHFEPNGWAHAAAHRMFRVSFLLILIPAPLKVIDYFTHFVAELDGTLRFYLLAIWAALFAGSWAFFSILAFYTARRTLLLYALGLLPIMFLFAGFSLCQLLIIDI